MGWLSSQQCPLYLPVVGLRAVAVLSFSFFPTAWSGNWHIGEVRVWETKGQGKRGSGLESSPSSATFVLSDLEQVPAPC